MTTKLAVIGAGLMGGGIALDAARHGLMVTIYDSRANGVEMLRARAGEVYARWVKSGRMEPSDADGALARLRPASSLADIAGADLVIEAVFEDLQVKRDLYAALLPHLTARSVVATNTSALEVKALSEGFGFADRFLGLHYFSPAEVSPLVEVVRAPATSDATLARALAFLDETRRVPLACLDRPGFAINRFFCPYYNEATRLVEDGIAGPADVDGVARDRVGAAAGPFAVMNLIRPQVAAHAVANLASLGAFYTPSRTLEAQAHSGASWSLDESKPSADLDAVEQRLLGALALPAMELVCEGVATPAEVDRGAMLALKFKYGPFALMRRHSAEFVEQAVLSLCRRHGHPVPDPLAAIAAPGAPEAPGAPGAQHSLSLPQHRGQKAEMS